MAGGAIYLMGPTAAGKTALALALAERYGLEIVSVDSALVYRGLDIGTAKPDPAIRARVAHHLIDICEPTEAYSVGRFVDDARRLCEQITARGRVPLLTGGTMLYFRALQSGLATLPPRDATVRAQLNARAAGAGWPALHAELAAIDPRTASRIAPKDAQRIQRALEVHALTGRRLSDFQREDLRGASAASLKLIVSPADRARLHARIEARFAAMLAAGFAEEVRGLYARGDLDASMPALRAVGYRQLYAWCEGRLDLAEASRLALQATRQLAKRQLTWLRAEPSARWFDPDGPRDPDRLVAAVGAWLDGDRGA